VIADDDGAVRIITLNRPARLNAFTAQSYRSLADVLDTADRDPRVRVALLVGSGRAFSSGVDLDALTAAGAGGAAREGRNEFAETFDRLLHCLMAFGKPLLAAVHGVAVGFGATILLHCDIVLVADDARLRMPFTDLGTTPEAGSSALLPMQVGPQHAADVLYTSRWVDGAEAVRIGLAARSYPADRLRDEAGQLAQEIAARPPEAVAAAKRLIRAGRAGTTQAALDREREESGRLHAVLGPLRRGPT
jgi:enoyl-CoA hydratase/carnithine racemase